MRAVWVATGLIIGLTTSALAELQPKSIAFLKELKINPESPDIKAIADDKVGKYSLDELAAHRSEDAVKNFIATRDFIRKYRKDTRTPFPSTERYQIYYLTDEEKKFISSEMMKPQKK